MADTFVPKTTLAADFSSNANWSAGAVPAAGTTALIAGDVAMVDPLAAIAADVRLTQGGALSGDGGGFALAFGSTVEAAGEAALYADGAIVNRGVIGVDAGATLAVVVENGDAAAVSPLLKLPSFENAAHITIGAGGTLAVAGTELSNQGAIVIDGGTLIVAAGGVDGGQAVAPAGGDIVLEAGGLASFADAVADQTVSFAGGGTIAFADAADVTDVSIHGFSRNATILAASVEAGGTLLQNLDFIGLPADETPVVVATAGGAMIELEPTPPCFARGTGILTPAGYVPVERLKPGDPVVTLAGGVRPVRWVGSRTLDIAGHRRADAVRPIRILAGALGIGVPARTVRLSPDHALLLRGKLVPIKLLVNGATILRELDCLAVTYLHVELDRHDILLADNLAAESYLDTGNRSAFAQAAGQGRPNPVFGRGKQWDARAYAELCLAGPVLKAIRRFVRARALELGYRPRILPEISLWLGSTRLPPAAGSIDRPVFRFPPLTTGTASLRSARFVPAEFSLGDEDEDDYRTLGIAIRRIRIGKQNFAPADLAISGFHPRAKADTADWTTGNATIRLPATARGVTLEIAALPQGWLPPV